MTDTPDPLESSFAAAFADVMKPRPDDAARLDAMVARAALPAPVAAAPAASSAKLLAGVGAAVGVTALAVLLFSSGSPTPSGPAKATPVAPSASVEPSPTPRDRSPSVAATAPAPASENPEPAPATDPARTPTDRAVANVPDRTAPSPRAPRAAVQEPEDPSPPSAAELLARANTARRAGDFAAADRGFADLQARYPGSREAILALVTHGRLLLDELDRPGDALARFDAYLDARPRGTLAEEAMVGRARALERAGDRAEADAAWADLRARFPQSVHARDVP